MLGQLAQHWSNNGSMGLPSHQYEMFHSQLEASIGSTIVFFSWDMFFYETLYAYSPQYFKITFFFISRGMKITHMYANCEDIWGLLIII